MSLHLSAPNYKGDISSPTDIFLLVMETTSIKIHRWDMTPKPGLYDPIDSMILISIIWFQCIFCDYEPMVIIPMVTMVINHMIIFYIWFQWHHVSRSWIWNDDFFEIYGLIRSGSESINGNLWWLLIQHLLIQYLLINNYHQCLHRMNGVNMEG